MNIVIIDDVAQDEFIRALKKLNHNPVHFYSADTAYLHILTERYTIDLVFIDEELDKSTSKIYQSGTELGRAILKEITYIPLVMYTGTAYNPENNVDIVAVEHFSYIVEKGDFGKDREEHIKKIINLEGVKGKWMQKETLVLQLIKKHLTNLSAPKYNKYVKELIKKAKVNWKNDSLLIELAGTNYALDELLFTPIKGKRSITTHIEYIIKSSKRNYDFKGDWIVPTKGIKEQLDLYWALPIDKYEKVTNDIDRIAFDYLLNVLYIKNKMEDKMYDNSNLELNINNRKVCVTNGCHKVSANGDDNRFLHFKYKLIGRRVTYGYSKYIGFSDLCLFEKKHLAALMQKGNTNTEKTKKTGKQNTTKEITNPTIFSTNLGLFANLSNPNEFIMDENKVMFEEDQWLLNYANCANGVRKFLDEFTSEVIAGLNLNFIQEEFTDLSDFLIYYSGLRSKCSVEMKQNLNINIEHYLSDNIQQPTIDLLNSFLTNT
jgi:hypothetical protein